MVASGMELPLLSSVGKLIQNKPEISSEPTKKMTYNEWREMRPKQAQYKKPECQTHLQSLEVQAGYTVKLSVIVCAVPEPEITWSLDDTPLDDGTERFELEFDPDENKYSLKINQISKREEGTYQLTATNPAGSDSTIGFITVKVPTKSRKRSVSQRPLISTIMESKSKEESATQMTNDRILFHNRSCWDWWNLSSNSAHCICRLCAKRVRNPETEHRYGSENKVFEFLNESLDKSKSRSLPDISSGRVLENKYQKLKNFWEVVNQ